MKRASSQISSAISGATLKRDRDAGAVLQRADGLLVRQDRIELGRPAGPPPVIRYGSPNWLNVEMNDSSSVTTMT